MWISLNIILSISRNPLQPIVGHPEMENNWKMFDLQRQILPLAVVAMKKQIPIELYEFILVNPPLALNIAKSNSIFLPHEMPLRNRTTQSTDGNYFSPSLFPLLLCGHKTRLWPKAVHGFPCQRCPRPQNGFAILHFRRNYWRTAVANPHTLCNYGTSAYRALKGFCYVNIETETARLYRGGQTGCDRERLAAGAGFGFPKAIQFILTLVYPTILWIHKDLFLFSYSICGGFLRSREIGHRKTTIQISKVMYCKQKPKSDFLSCSSGLHPSAELLYRRMQSRSGRLFLTSLLHGLSNIETVVIKLKRHKWHDNGFYLTSLSIMDQLFIHEMR